ncbi:glycoside hydrolase family 2 [Microbacterium sp. STN6]|uniref:glycoside hydrolase family 2 protein n=1 Tax=Microbacterium sp. STN6 TaxID=2995588 RepID=UPI002261026B|nr:sugar-binding domain-containing protein [Microbacterium sp. STN6]MCX7521813.1 glycoside hydrolase family 2 [Microbacterium sp. STN6]
MSRRTAWADGLDPEHVLGEYPRPQLVRDSYLNLNGLWNYAITKGAEPPTTWDGRILVPFSPEAALSGVDRQLLPGEHLWYERTVQLPAHFNRGRVLLHFGAVDQHCVVSIDGRQVGGHSGGYLPFSIDVTDALGDGAAHLLRVEVTDESDRSYHSRGKQSLRRGGIWYTAQSGIWQTVWLESVPTLFVDRLEIRPRLDDKAVEIVVMAGGMRGSGAARAGDGDARGAEATVVLSADGVEHARASGRAGAVIRLALDDVNEWSPEHPFLYDIEVTFSADTVTSYVGMRSVAVERDSFGMPRLTLNGRPYLHIGVLDQGYWPDGLYTAPSDDALVHDIRSMKDLGFTMLRKHIKIEPLRWYYHCDRLGILVWQDMVNGGRAYNPLVITTPVLLPVRVSDRRHRVFGRQDAAGRDEYRAELTATVELLRNTPSVVVWVPFNEGWGQFDALDATRRIRSLDPDRLVDHASGWHDQGGGDLRSLHVYFRRIRPRRSWGRDGRAVVISEYGGYSLRLPGHEFGDREVGYRRLASIAALTEAFVELHRDQVLPAIDAGVTGVVYTQLSDVEDEVNGLLTADRTVLKLTAESVRQVNRELVERFQRVTGARDAAAVSASRTGGAR